MHKDMSMFLFRLSPRFLLLLFCLSTALPAMAGDAVTASIVQPDAASCTAMQAAGVLRAHSPVPCNRLRRVQFSYVDFDGRRHDDGEIVVLDAAAPHVRAIFDALLQRRFPLAHARAMMHYRGDDEAAMRDNNTSAFNDRAITGGSAPSLHAYGLAIDINPVQNPYVEIAGDGNARFHPAAGSRYANRAAVRPGKPTRAGMAEDVVELFAQHGFTTWGGDWDAPIDYQHFQVSRTLAQKLAALPPEQARAAFDAHATAYRRCRKGGGTRAACAR